MKSQMNKCPDCGEYNNIGHVCVNKRLGPSIDQDAFGWRRIETAPAETRILMFEDPMYGDQTIDIGIVLLNGDGERVAYVGNRSAYVTRWMPLPHWPIDT